MAHPYQWIQRSGVNRPGHKGRLHRALGYRQGTRIPESALLRKEHAPGRLGREARFALTMRKIAARRRRRALHLRAR